MDIFFLILLVFLLSMQNAGWKLFGSRFLINDLDGYGFNTVVCGFMAVLFWGITLAQPHNEISVSTFIYAALLGICFPLCLLCNVKALATGSMAYTSLITSASLLIPTFFGSLFFKEPFSILQFAGIVILLFSFSLGVYKTEGKETKAFSFTWLFFAVLSSVLNGMVAVFQKIHAMQLNGKESTLFLATGFTIATVFMFSVTSFKGKSKKERHYQNLFLGRLGKLLLLGVVTALCGGMGNWFVLLLSGKMAANILFPVANGGILVVTSIFSVLFFKEKLNRRQIVGLIFGTVAILLVSNVFS